MPFAAVDDDLLRACRRCNNNEDEGYGAVDDARSYSPSAVWWGMRSPRRHAVPGSGSSNLATRIEQSVQCVAAPGPRKAAVLEKVTAVEEGVISRIGVFCQEVQDVSCRVPPSPDDCGPSARPVWR